MYQKSKEELSHLTMRYDKLGGCFLVDDVEMMENIGVVDVGVYKDWIALQRYMGREVSGFSLYRRLKDTNDFYHIDLFRFRLTIRGGISIPTYGPDLQITLNSKANHRRTSNKKQNYQVLSLLYNGDLDSTLRCLDCKDPLQGRQLHGYDTGFRGDLHHIVVLDNKSYCKEAADPSKRLESSDLKNGKDDKSLDCLLDLMGCVPFCKGCHSDWHSMFAKRSHTKHSDIRDYFENNRDIRPWFIQNPENYQKFVDVMVNKFGYSILPTYNEWLNKLHLPSDLKLKWD